VEVDFSWALIHSILLAFNNTDIVKYLQVCWQMRSTCHEFEDTVIHLCAAHFIHMIMGKCKNIKDKGVRSFFGYCIGLLQNATNMKDIEDVFLSMNVVFCMPYQNNDYDEKLDYLKQRITKEKESLDEHTISEEDDEWSTDDFTDSSVPLYQRSPFYEHFQHLKDESDEKMAADSDSIDGDNEYFRPDLMDIIMKYMGYVPMWTGLFIYKEGLTRDTNAIAENWFRIVKHDILQRKKRLRPATFFKMMRTSLNGRLRRNELHERKTKLKQRKSSDHFNESEEKWNKRCSQKRKTYYDAPKEIPAPKKKQRVHSSKEQGTQANTKNRNASDDEIMAEQEENDHIESKHRNVKSATRARAFENKCAIPWNGTYKGADLINTCTLDVGLQVLHVVTSCFQHVQEYLESQRAINSIDILMQCLALIQRKQFNASRGLWIEKVLKLKPTKHVSGTTRYDLWGNECGTFINYIVPVQKAKYVSCCDDENCPRKIRHCTSHSIILKYV
jgi:hypothetical protein